MKNNKGFSLVELIIVIAIMAVLVGVLAPTYLQYVEKSKKSNDVSTVDSIASAIEICAIDPEVTTAGSWSLTATLDKNTGTDIFVATGEGGDKMVAALAAIVPQDTVLKSDKWDDTNNKFVITAEPDGLYGKVKIKMVPASDNANAAYHAYAKNAKISATS